MKKIILIIIISSIICYFIYNNTYDKKQDIMIISDFQYTKKDKLSFVNLLKENLPKSIYRTINTDYISPTLTISTINNYIDNNNKYNNKHIKQLIESSEYIIILLGNNEISYLNYYNNLTQQQIQIFINNYKSLLEKITNLNTKKIIVFNLIAYNNKINKINNSIYKLCKNNNIIYIDSLFLLNSGNILKRELKSNDNIRIYNKIKEEIKL